MKLKNSFHTYAFITVFFWSFAYVFTRILLKYYTAFSLGFLRYFIASITLAIFIVLFKIKPIKFKDLPWFFFSGGTGFFVYMIFFNLGCITVNSATSSIIVATVPVITAILANIVYKEKLRSRQWIAVLIEFAGIIILTLTDSGLSADKGILWLLIASVNLSLYNLIQRHLLKTYSSLTVTAYSIFVGTILLAIFAPTSISEVKAAPANSYIYLILLGIFPSAVAFISWAKAFKLAEKTSYVSNYMFVTPLLTAVLGFILAHEVPTLQTLWGGVVILLGAYLFNRKVTPKPQKSCIKI